MHKWSGINGTKKRQSYEAHTKNMALYPNYAFLPRTTTRRLQLCLISVQWSFSKCPPCKFPFWNWWCACGLSPLILSLSTQSVHYSDCTVVWLSSSTPVRRPSPFYINKKMTRKNSHFIGIFQIVQLSNFWKDYMHTTFMKCFIWVFF
jgi:hypothetical protein